MCANEIKLKTAYKNSHLSNLKITYYDDETAIFRELSVDKRRKEMTIDHVHCFSFT